MPIRLKGTRNYRFELYYWDYGLGIFLISVVLAFTMGSFAGGPTAFLANLHSADDINLFYAALGGFIFNIANVLLVAGIEIVGLAIAFPISIGIALVEGVVLSYALQPRGNPMLLGAGVFMAVVAVVLVGKAYGALRVSVVSRRGVVVCVISGLLMGIFAPFVTRAMTRGNTLTPYTTAVFLTLGAFLCCFVFNTILMRKPIVGSPVAAADYFRAPGSYHALGLLGGVIWGMGQCLILWRRVWWGWRSRMRLGRRRRWWLVCGGSSSGRSFAGPMRGRRGILRRCLGPIFLRSR